MLNEAPHPLLQPRRLGDLLLPNRVVIAPLTRGRANNPGHVPNDLMRQYYEQRATAGLIISEGTWVSEDGQGGLGAPGIYNHEQGGGWKAITDAVHAKGGRIFAHFGTRELFRIPPSFMMDVFLSRHRRSIRCKRCALPVERR